MQARWILGTTLAALALLFAGCSEDGGSNDDQPEADVGAGGEGGAGGGGEVSTSALNIAADGDLKASIGSDLQLTLTATLSDDSTLDVTADAAWASSDEGVATVSAGTVTGVAPGSATITGTYGGLDTTVDVTVEAPSLDRIEVSGDLALNDTFQLTAVAHFTDGSTVDVTEDAEWGTNNERIVTLDGAGTGSVAETGGPVNVTATIDGMTGILDTTVECIFPAYADIVRFGGRLPPVNWAEARNAAGEVMEFSAQDFMCFDQYRDKNVLFVVINAGWCAPCHARIRQIARLWDKIEESGGEVLLLTSETTNFTPASSEYANGLVNRLVGDRYGIRVGDMETFIEDDEVPDFFRSSGFVQYYPTVFAVRKSDMVVIAEQGQSRFILPYANIAANPDQDWSNPGPPETISNCGPDDEEASEPANNFARQASRLEAGEYTGGICDAESDFYFIDIEGDWRVDLEFDHSTGDLDVYGWDIDQGQVLVSNGNLVGSDTEESVETFTHSGRTYIMVQGFFGQSAPYTLRVTEL